MKNEDEKSNRLVEIGDKMQVVGKDMQSVGNNMMGCGCLLTIFITIPIIIIIFLL